MTATNMCSNFGGLCSSLPITIFDKFSQYELMTALLDNDFTMSKDDSEVEYKSHHGNLVLVMDNWYRLQTNNF